jgi:hypothetical protein
MRYISFLLGIVLSTQTYAITCYLTMVKGGCWKKYDLTVDLSDADSGKVIRTVLVPGDQPWVRQEFECKAGDTLAVEAKFSPVFWEGDDDKTFKGQRYWKLPDEIKPGETGWNVTICFPKQFSDVPSPPEASNCDCDFTTIPKIEPPKLPPAPQQNK